VEETQEVQMIEGSDERALGLHLVEIVALFEQMSQESETHYAITWLAGTRTSAV
jgi:hypothetical protein